MESYVCSWPRPCLGLKAMGAQWELGPVRALHPAPVPTQEGEGGSGRAYCPASGATRQCVEMFLLWQLPQGHVCEMALRVLHGTALPEMCRCLRAAAEKPHSQLWVLLLQVVTLSTTPTRSSFWSALTSIFVATPSALAPKSSEVSFVFWGSQAWADAGDTLSAGARAHRESLCWSVQAPMGGQPRLCRD